MSLKPPTVAEQAWMDAIVRIGCIVCILLGWGATPGEVHHMLSGGRKMGHAWTLCLCPSHHRSGLCNKQIISRDHSQRRFEERYWPETELHAATRVLVNKMKELEV